MSPLAHRAVEKSAPCAATSWRARSRATPPRRAGNAVDHRLLKSPSPSSSSTPARRYPRCDVFAASNNDNETSSSSSSSSSSTSSSSSAEDLAREENVWNLKPLWCRPPSIVATGVAVVAGADVVGGRFLALAALAGVLVWWWAFLIEYPAAYREYIRGTRHKGGYARSADVEEFYGSGSGEDESDK